MTAQRSDPSRGNAMRHRPVLCRPSFRLVWESGHRRPCAKRRTQSVAADPLTEDGFTAAAAIGSILIQLVFEPRTSAARHQQEAVSHREASETPQPADFNAE